jgi:hypothetical protein
MSTFFRVALLDLGIIVITFIIFSAAIPGAKRHVIWEKYISSFAKFVIYIFIATLVINVLTAYIAYTLGYERYLNIIAPTVQSFLIGLVAACVPRRGVGDNTTEEVK